MCDPLLFWAEFGWDAVMATLALSCLGIAGVIAWRSEDGRFWNFFSSTVVLIALILAAYYSFCGIALIFPSLPSIYLVTILVLLQSTLPVFGVVLFVYILRSPRLFTPPEIQRQLNSLRHVYNQIGYRIEIEKVKGEQLKSLNYDNKQLLFLSKLLDAVVPSLASFEKIEDRLLQFDRVADLLIINDWGGVRIQQIIQYHLDLFGIAEDSIIRGPEVRLSPLDTLSFAFAIFELCVNSTNHAALIGKGARYNVEWTTIQRGEEPYLLFRWREESSKIVAPSLGLGYKVLTEIVPQAMKGEAKLEFLPLSVEWQLWSKL